MPDLLSAHSSYSAISFIFPYSLTLMSIVNNPMPYNFHSMPDLGTALAPLVQNHPWEEAYKPSIIIDYSDEEKLSILQDFTVKLMSNMHDMPSEFAEILSDNFWELI